MGTATDATAGLEDGWFRVTEPEPSVVCIEEPLHVEKVKSYLILGDERALLLDTGMGVGDLPALVRRRTSLPLVVVQSHAHFDHMGATARFAGAANILIHPDQADDLRTGETAERLRRWFAPDQLLGPLPPGVAVADLAIPGAEPTGPLYGGETIDLGGRTLEVLHVPGHCPGLLALLDRERGVLWSTDAVYASTDPRYDGALYAQRPDSDLAVYQETLDRLVELAPSLTRLYPAHGDNPISPDLLAPMRDALAAIRGGRVPDRIADGTAEHDFAGFSILVRAPEPPA